MSDKLNTDQTIQSLIFRNEMLEEHLSGKNTLDRTAIQMIVDLNKTDLDKLQVDSIDNDQLYEKQKELTKGLIEIAANATKGKASDDFNWLTIKRENDRLKNQNKILRVANAMLNGKDDKAKLGF